MKHRRIIRYLGVDPLSSYDDHALLKYYSVSVESHGIKIYANAFLKLCRLEKPLLNFLFFLFSEADLSCNFRNNKAMRGRFEKFCYESGQKIMGPRTITRWLTELTDLELLNKISKSRGTYGLSPVFFYVEQDYHYNERERSLRKELEHPIRHLAARFRAESLADKELDGILKDVSRPDL